MKKPSVIINVILILVINIFYNYNTSASPTSEILCNGWLESTLKTSCRQDTDCNLKGSTCNGGTCSAPGYITTSPKSSLTDGDHRSTTYELSDNVGVRGACRDYFPTWFEREMFYRTSDDALTMELKLHRQYCGIRYLFVPTPDNCGAPNVKWEFIIPVPRWDKGANYALWTGNIELTFSLKKMGSKNSQTVFWGSNYAYIDYDKTADGKQNPKRVCAFYSPTFLASVFTDGEKIGCIDIPLYPAPNIYNKIIVPKESVKVSNVTPSDSTFIKPQINLQLIDSTGQPKGGYTTLTYNYEDYSSSCSKVSNSTYCPFIPSYDPTKICARSTDNISGNIGCIDRPRPTDSGIKLNAIHNYFIDNNCLDDSGNPSIFHSLKIQLLSSNNKLIKEFPEQNSGLRDYYACYVPSQYKDKNSNKMVKQTITLSGDDTTDVFGIKFSAVIPELTDPNLDVSKISPDKFKKTYMYPPIITEPSKTTSDTSCNQCFVPVNEDNCIDNNPTSKERGQSMCTAYITPAGKRDRKSCNRAYSCYNFKNNPPPIEHPNKYIVDCHFGSGSDKDPDSSYNAAEKAYCRGIYTIDQQNKGKNSKSQTNVICMNLETNWPNFYGNSDKICVEIPGKYMKLDINDVSSLTDYIDFTDDGFDPKKEYTDQDKLQGKCDSSIGLENEKCLSTDGKTCTKLSDISDYKNNDTLKNQFVNFKADYMDMQNYLYGNEKNKGINSNTLPIDENLLKYLGYSKDLLKKNFSVIPAHSNEGPYRILNGNFPIGTLHNGCRFIIGEDGCGKNNITAPFLGNAIFDASNLNIKIGDKLQVSNKNPIAIPNNEKLIINDIPVEGTCAKGFKPTDNENPPTRTCRVIVKKDGTIITKSWSNAKINNPCISNNQSNG